MVEDRRFSLESRLDISLHKEFALAEEKSFDFRVDFFNAFNHSIFG